MISGYDLEERTAKFGEAIITLVKTTTGNGICTPINYQIVRSATSVGANYMEADGSNSKKDFEYKISLCRKEIKETKHWLRMLALAEPKIKFECRKLWKEAQELTLIFSAILKSCKRNKKLN